jgi:hypothetical protein
LNLIKIFKKEKTMSIEMRPTTDNRIIVHEKPDNVPAGNLGGAGRLLNLSQDEAKKYLSDHGIDPSNVNLTGPDADGFVKVNKT